MLEFLLERDRYFFKTLDFGNLIAMEYAEKRHYVNDLDMKEVYYVYNEDHEAYKRKHPRVLQSGGMICVCIVVLFRIRQSFFNPYTTLLGF